MKHRNQCRIASRRSWHILFVAALHLEGAAQQNNCTLFFSSAIDPQKIKCKISLHSTFQIHSNNKQNIPDLRDAIVHWLEWFMVIFVKDMKRKEHFPHLLPLKEGGEDFNFIVVGCTNTIMKWMNQCRIPPWRWWYISFILFVMLESAAQQSFCTLFFSDIFLFLCVNR